MVSVNSDLKKKIFLTLAILLVYRFGTFVPIPGVNVELLRKFFADSNGIGMFGMVNLFSGGALERMSIFALNIMPYITSSIIMQLLTSMYSGLEALKKEGEYGRVKLNQYTRYLTIILAFFQSIGAYYAISSTEAFPSGSSIFMWTTCISLVGGTVILMWFGEKITSHGIGNGISLIIFIGIVSALPSTISQIFNLSKMGVYSWFIVLLFFVGALFFLAAVCFIEKTSKRIRIQYPNASMMKSSGLEDSSFLPLKINVSGVIPPIFASSILMFPSVLVQFTGYDDSNYFISLLRRGGILYLTLFAALIVFFSYFYSSVVFNTKDVANNLKKSNCFILGVRPGVATSEYLDKVLSRLSLIGAIYLIFICVLPEVLVTNYSIPLGIGGTGILIMVSVILDFAGQIQSHLFASRYNSISRKRRVKVRV